MHLNGTGTKKDTAKYVEYMEKAAAGGRMASVMNIADAYHAGRWVAKDDAKALKWYLKAAVAGGRKAQYNVAVMYRDGEGTEADPKKAEEWFKAYSRSAIVGHQIGASDASRYVDLNVPADQIILLQQASENHSGLAASLLAAIYRDGIITSVNRKKAAELYSKTDGEFASFDMAVADSYYHGFSGKPDYTKAFEIYHKLAATNGDPVAFLKLARMYHDGIGTEKDLEKYVKCLQFSAERGNKDALVELSHIKKKQ